VARLALITVICGVALGFAHAEASATINRTACTGYAQKRIYVGSQEWWTRTPGQDGTNQGHLHAEACVPYRRRLSGRIRFDVRVVMHHNPGHVSVVSMKAVQPRRSTVLGTREVSFDCSRRRTCSFWTRLVVRTGRAPFNGWTQLRLKAQGRTSDGNTRSSIIRFGAYLANGKPRRDYFKTRELDASGWYSDAGYANARMLSRVRRRAISGDWWFKTAFDLTPESGGGDRVTHRFVSVDPDFHMGDRGTVIVDASQRGDWTGWVKIDTRRFANGRHKLFLRADARDPRGSTNSGALVIRFRVAN
jgi:hypothetical protein